MHSPLIDAPIMSCPEFHFVSVCGSSQGRYDQIGKDIHDPSIDPHRHLAIMCRFDFIS
jgi:hypothetical protein